MSTEVQERKIIYHTKGDSLLLYVRMDITDREGNTINDYKPQGGDKVRFALKKSYSDPEPLLLVDIPNETQLLRLNPEDTKDLKVGKYVYDCEITFSDGFVDTFIKEAPFNLTPEVH